MACFVVAWFVKGPQWSTTRLGPGTQALSCLHQWHWLSSWERYTEICRWHETLWHRLWSITSWVYAKWLTLWTSQWQMKFNTDKCSVMHIGARNMQYTYTMNGQVLQQVESQSTLGVIIRKDLKASDQCAKQSICQSQSSIGNDRQKHTIQKYWSHVKIV